MSRYEIHNGVTNTVVVVGWDESLATYFAQVWDERAFEPDDADGEPEPLLWAGCRTGEIRTVEHLDSVLAPHATLPEEIRQQLLRDRAAAHAGGFTK
jgi:hypothetical protein